LYAFSHLPCVLHSRPISFCSAGWAGRKQSRGQPDGREGWSRKVKKKGKTIPVTGREGPQGCETSRLPHFL
jgi:hypothetical protein